MARPNHNSNGSLDAELPKAKFSKENIRQALLIFRYVKPHRWKFAAGLLFIALSSASTMAFPYLLKKLIDSAGAVNQAKLQFTTGNIAFAMILVLTVQMFFSFMRRFYEF